MMCRCFVILLAVCVGLLAPMPVRAPASSIALAQDTPELPELGDTVLADPLQGNGVLRSGVCTTGRSRADFVPEGFRQKVTGRCVESATVASIRTATNGLSLADGEIAAEIQVLEGAERADILLIGRLRESASIFLAWEPGNRRIELRKASGPSAILLAERTGLAPPEPGAWTRLALRFDGETVWGTVGDQTISAKTLGVEAAGGAAVYLRRFGNLDDEAPVTAVWRNLQVSSLAGGDEARAPTYAPAASAPVAAAPGPPTFIAATGTPPGVGQTVYEHSLREPGPIPNGICETGNGRGLVAGEGFLVSLQGRCRNGASGVSVFLPVRGLQIPDGDLRLDFRMTSGHDRLMLSFFVRVQDGPLAAYDFVLVPGRGFANITKVLPTPPGQILNQRTDLRNVIRRDDWNTVSMRLNGSSLWLLVNDQPALSADDGAYYAGKVWLLISRLGNADEGDEIAVLLRNLRLSAIDGAPDDRAPTASPPAGAPADAPAAPPAEPPTIPTVIVGLTP